MRFKLRLTLVPLARTSAETELDARRVFSPCTSAETEMDAARVYLFPVGFRRMDVRPVCLLPVHEKVVPLA